MAKGKVTYSTISSTPNDEEREELLDSGNRSIRRSPILFLVLSLALSALVGSSVFLHSRFSAPKPKRNVIMMISDGFGPASETYSRLYYQWSKNLPVGYKTPLDTILVGASRTRSNSSMITDSAAGATAISCAQKTFNNAVGVDPFEEPCGTLLEAAKANGMLTGLVVTSRITHATPASFSSHVVHRNLEHLIAEHQIGNYVLGPTVDLMFGGGRCFFLPNTTEGSCRPDTKNLIRDAQQRGFRYIQSREQFDSLKSQTHFPLMGLFALDHMDYDIDRDPQVQPALSEMTQKALDLLNKASEDSDKGFFMMIEGSRIDMGAHNNDPIGHLHDILAYQETIEVVKAFVDANPGTVMISVSDHETGGFTVGRQVTETYPEYIWYPEVISKCKKSTSYLGKLLFEYSGENRKEYVVNDILKEQLEIVDPTEDEVGYLLEAHTLFDFIYHLSKMVSVRAQLGWTTHGHTGVDVNLYAYGSNSHELSGNHENTEIGDFISNYLNLNLDTITTSLKKNPPQLRADAQVVKRLTNKPLDIHQDYIL
ncbi:alkaline phosphatase [Basidiobolus meristosporus CBS 931.73]|uniref:Alkaline phosphatase n=1 Tax=Basidiobolus meristosporus CBS 931.73 TaxID=1314790 RepID=A0A1Y1YQW5_9FUNG|nr:alkaline phosphatase [Basidiobolus meristosporus CBS 931.73]|eukprot:ORY00204.1 alkaline phosphatase [Basidiobolus meristosporus CBS 931.73]